jgi:hypothetical protein
MRYLLLIFAMLGIPAAAQTAAPFASLNFLLGTWNAKTTAQGSAAAEVLGAYTFQTDLNGTVITRTGSPDSCKAPAGFDCRHHDSLIIYSDMGDPVLHAFYADNEGHVLHYDLSTPDPNTVVFLSNMPGPKFRLTYHLEGSVMSGKFQFAAPGSTDFKSYLEWSGSKK